MSATSSNLSDARYGYDLVCATTQNAVNATMKSFLAGADTTEFSACYVSDPVTRKKVLKPLAEIISVIGGDPFSIPNNSTGTNPMVQKLYEARFAFGFKAKMGLPAGVTPANMPDIIRLDKGNSRVSYQLYLAEFSVLVLNQEFGDLSLVNIQQPASSPWLFEFEVNLAMRAGDQNSFNQLPQEVQERIKNINPSSMFSVQQLYLDLNSRGLQQMPTIQGLDPASDAYVYLTRTFINQYWINLGPSGVVLGYGVKPATVDNRLPSIIPTDLNIEISPYVDANGNATTQYGLYTIDYLVMSQNRKMPPAVPFTFNWVDAAQQQDYHGAMAIRRDVFTDYLLSLVNQNVASLCIDPAVELHHDGESFTTSFRWTNATSPGAFSKVASPGAPGADGFTSMMTISYSHGNYDDSLSSSHLASINGTFNYTLNGDVAFGGNNKIRITLHGVVYVEFNTHEAGVKHVIVEGNKLDLVHTITYEVGVTTDGKLAVSQKSADAGGVNDLSYGSDPLMTNLGDLKDNVTSCANAASTRITSAMADFGNQIEKMINNSHAWVLPGGKTFAYKAAGFSTGLDLVTHVTYVDPS